MVNKVYIITDGEYYKIGKSRNPINRLNGLQTDNPRKLTLMFITEETIISEVQTHEFFKNEHIRGEWFKIEKNKLDHFIKNHASLTPIVKFCSYCGKEFIPRSRRSKYCSERCIGIVFSEGIVDFIKKLNKNQESKTKQLSLPESLSLVYNPPKLNISLRF